MVTTFRIARIYLKETLGSFISGASSASGGKKGGSTVKKILIMLLPLLFLPQVFVLSYYVYGLMRDIGAASVAISLFVLAATTMIFFTAFSTVVTSIGGDAAVTQLLSQPVKPNQLFQGRLALTYFIAMLESLYLLLPISVIYALDFGWHTLGLSVIVALLVPAVPISICLLFISPFARLFAKPALKKFIPYVLNIGFLALYFWIMISLNPTNMEVSGNINIVNIMLKLVGSYYPPAALAGEFTAGNLVSGLIYVGISAFFVAVALGISGFFAKVMLYEGVSAGASKKGKVGFESRSVMSWLFMRQLRIMFSSHRFVLQSVGSLFVMPILLVVYSLTGIIDAEALGNWIIALDAGPLVIFALMVSGVVFTTIGVTNVAREGSTFWENKVMPVSAVTQVASRLLFSVLMSLPVGVAMCVYVAVVFEISVFQFVLGIVPAIGYIMFFMSLDHIMDMKMPNLGWTNELQAVKNSKQVVLSSLYKLLIGGLIGGGTYFGLWSFGLQTSLIAAAAVGVLLGAGGMYLLFTKGVRMFEKIEA